MPGKGPFGALGCRGRLYLLFSIVDLAFCDWKVLHASSEIASADWLAFYRMGSPYPKEVIHDALMRQKGSVK